jgi:transcriptional regulator with XRE-family HTH domain
LRGVFRDLIVDADLDYNISTARRTNLDVRHLQKVEAADVNLTLKTLGALAKGLRVSLRDFFK